MLEAPCMHCSSVMLSAHARPCPLPSCIVTFGYGVVANVTLRRPFSLLRNFLYEQKSDLSQVDSTKYDKFGSLLAEVTPPDKNTFSLYNPNPALDGLVPNN